MLKPVSQNPMKIKQKKPTGTSPTGDQKNSLGSKKKTGDLIMARGNAPRAKKPTQTFFSIFSDDHNPLFSFSLLCSPKTWGKVRIMVCGDPISPVPHFFFSIIYIFYFFNVLFNFKLKKPIKINRIIIKQYNK